MVINFVPHIVGIPNDKGGVRIFVHKNLTYLNIRLDIRY
jgi:hypothetical protein